MTAGQLLALAALGAFHGLNPAMGWLFAVARGLQEASRTRIWTALPPIAAGHLASVAIVAAVVSATSSAVTGNAVAVAGGTVLIGFGLWRLLSERHFRWTGMRLSPAQLGGWSFLVSSARGAGLMLLPVLATTPAVAGHHHLAGPVGGGALTGLLAAGVHTVAMLLVMGLCALVVYSYLGVAVLRRAWFNIDRLWAVVLIVAGGLTAATAF